jgi:hypothetical protein
MKRYQFILAILAILLAMGVVGHFDAEDAQLQQDNYCEMVKLWKQSNGKSGWPAYNGEAVCK